MGIKNVLLGLFVAALVVAPLMGSAVANVPGIAINAPPPPPAPNVAVQGGMGMIKVVVTHRDTFVPATHYVDHVYLYDGDKLLKEWKYTANDANSNEIFSETWVTPATADMNLRAIAHCTVHGYSAADVFVKVLPAGTTPSQMVNMDASVAGTQAFGYSDPSMASKIAPAGDIAIIRQLASSEMADIQRHQQMTAQFFQTNEGKQFLKQLDYSAKGQPDANKLRDAVTSSSKQGIPQAVWTDAAGNIGNGPQLINLGKPAAKPTAAGTPTGMANTTAKPTAKPMR